MKIFSRILFASTVLAGCIGDSTSDIESAANGNGNGSGGGGSAQLSGALFTTTVDGSRVNANIYGAKEDVYIDGGPGPNAPAGAAALPPGDYYFQVTDPSGHTLLSQDALDCRKVRIGANEVIEHAYAGPGGCRHATGIDMDQASLGAITVQLMPYADTPNNGGVYKAWITPVEDIGPNGKFLHNRSKTDNFKVRTMTPPPPPEPSCGDGHVDAGEHCDDGNTMGGDGCSASCQPENPPPPPPMPSCGDHHVDAGEQCDDGNTMSGDGCSAMCQIEPPPPPPPSCGDEHLDAGEQCDDGNTMGGDGCSAMCTIEPPPPPSPSCGNGIVEVGEDCDDGNTTNGDGCSDMCKCVVMHDERVGG